MIPLKLKCQFHVIYNCCIIFDTKCDIYPNPQSLGFKPDTVSQSSDFKPDTVTQSLGFKPGTVSQSPGFKSSTVSQSPGFKPGTDAIHLPYFQTQAFKNYEISNQLTILSTKNYVTLILYPQ